MSVKLLFSSKYRELNATSQSLCSEQCSELGGYLPDGKTVGEVVNFYQKYVKTEDHNEITLYESLSYPWEAYAYMGVTYDFQKGLWLNDFDESPFNESIWLAISLGCCY